MSWEFIKQFKRMERWYKRIEIICQKTPDNMGNLQELDDVLAFFQNCYHLKDWVKNDSSSGILATDIENFIRQSNCLMICGDLCNGSKHLKINNPRIDSDTTINRSYTVAEHVTDPILKRDFIVTSGGRQYNALSLAKECIGAWKNFFSSHGMAWS